MLKLVKEKTIFNFWIRQLKEKRFKGKSHPFHCLENKKGGGVLIIPSDLQGNIALLKVFRPCINQIIYEFARGSLETGDSPKDSALREFQEEFGINIKPLKINYLGQTKGATFILDTNVYIFNLVFEDLSKFDIWGEYDGSYEEIYGKYYFSINNLNQMIKDNTIIDSLTIVGIYKYLLYTNLFKIS